MKKHKEEPVFKVEAPCKRKLLYFEEAMYGSLRLF